MPRRIFALTLLLALALAAPAAAKPRTGPSGVRFYTPPSPLPGAKHGDLIWNRALKGAARLKSAKSQRLVLYRSTGSNGKPIAVSGSVAIPKGKKPKGGWPVITYGHGTVGIADACAPSRASASSAVYKSYIGYAYPLLNRWLKAGFAVVQTDYQGLGTPGTHEFLNGSEEGRSMLDVVRAARKLDGSLSKRIGIAGHSQGGHAALWAASLAKSWTPELTVRGTVAFAPASHLEEQGRILPSLNSSLGNLGAFAGLVMRSIDVTRPDLGIGSQLSDRSAALYPETLTECLGPLGQPDSFGGLKGNEFFKSGANLDGFFAAVAKTDPEDLTIKTPVRVEQGESDTTVLPGFTQQLVDAYAKRGNPVVYKTYKGITHGAIVAAAAKDATTYLAKRL